MKIYGKMRLYQIGTIIGIIQRKNHEIMNNYNNKIDKIVNFLWREYSKQILQFKICKNLIMISIYLIKKSNKLILFLMDNLLFYRTVLLLNMW